MQSKTNNVNEVVFRGVLTALQRTNKEQWVGTMTDLSSVISRSITRQQRALLPGSPSALRVVINRVVNRIRNQGIGVRFGRAPNRMRTRFVKFAL
jgi:hypothetical protein